MALGKHCSTMACILSDWSALMWKHLSSERDVIGYLSKQPLKKSRKLNRVTGACLDQCPVCGDVLSIGVHLPATLHMQRYLAVTNREIADQHLAEEAVGSEFVLSAGVDLSSCR